MSTVFGSTLFIKREELFRLNEVLGSGLPVVDPFGPDLVEAVRKVLGRETWQELRLAPQHHDPQLLGMAVVLQDTNQRLRMHRFGHTWRLG